MGTEIAEIKSQVEEAARMIKEKQSFYLEAMCAAFLKMTDIPVTDVELVQRFDSERSEYVWFFRRKGDNR